MLPVNLRFDAPRVPSAVLAYGEVTGHAHVITSDRVRYTTDAQVCEALRLELVAAGILDPEARTVIGGLIVEGTDPVSLVHDEHEAHEIPPGYHAVFGPREYAPGELRRVSD